MTRMKHVLLVTNAVTPVEIATVKEALEQAREDSKPIQLSLAHVIPNLPTCYFNIPSMVMLAERYYEEAKESLAKVGAELNIKKENQWLITGSIKNETLRLAEKIEADFILASSTNIQDFHKVPLVHKEESSISTPANLSELSAPLS